MSNINWTEEEMILTLGFYKFEKNPDNKKKIKVFTDRMNKITGINRSPNGVDYRIANYKSVDPEYKKSGLNGGGTDVQLYFDKYVTNDPSLEQLANIYSNFLNGLSITDLKTAKNVIPNESKTKVISTVVYNRSQKVKDDTLLRANGYCELCGNKAPFETKEGKPFLEVHHYIPLSMDGKDELSNTLALCPNCHRRMHYGHDLNKNEKKKVDEILNK